MIGRRGQMLVSDASNKCMNKLLDKWMAGLKSLEKTKDLNFYRAVVEKQEEKTLCVCSFLCLEAYDLNSSADKCSLIDY